MVTGMKAYTIPLSWREYGHITVEANSLQEAIDYVLGPECPLPAGSYEDDSLMIDYETFISDEEVFINA